MDIKESLRDILFEIGKDIKVHKLQDGNLILDIDYEKYVEQITNLFNELSK